MRPKSAVIYDTRILSRGDRTLGWSQPSSPRRRRAATLVAAFALFAVGCIPAGSHTVSSFGAGGVSPGLYRSLGKTADSENCTWTQSPQSFGTPFLGGGSSDGPVYMELTGLGNGYLTVTGCITFWKVPSPWDRPLATPGQPFGNGDFLVGYEVAPGVYQAGATKVVDCTWTRVPELRRASRAAHAATRTSAPGRSHRNGNGESRQHGDNRAQRLRLHFHRLRPMGQGRLIRASRRPPTTVGRRTD